MIYRPLLPLARVLLVTSLTFVAIAADAADAAPAPATAPAPAPTAPTAPTATPPPAAGAPAATKTDVDVLELPKIQVTASRIKELDRELKRLDKAIAREKKNVKATDLDKVLNNSKLTHAAAIFGGNSAEYMEQVAATRVRYMETERDLLLDMKEPQTQEYLTVLKEELEKIREMRRELDKASH